MTDQPPAPPAPEPRSELRLTRAAFDMAASTINALPPEEAFQAALALLAEHRNLVEQCIGLRDIQVARVYDDRKMTLVELAETLRWGTGGKVTRGRMSQVVQNGRALRDGQPDDRPQTPDQPDDQPAA